MKIAWHTPCSIAVHSALNIDFVTDVWWSIGKQEVSVDAPPTFLIWPECINIVISTFAEADADIYCANDIVLYM